VTRDFFVHIHTELFVGIVYVPTNTLDNNDVTRDFFLRVDIRCNITCNIYTCNFTCMCLYMYM